MTNRKIYMAMLTGFFTFILTATPQAQETVLNEANCKIVVKNNIQGPVKWRCEGYLKGVEHVRSRTKTGGTSGTSTQIKSHQVVVWSPGTSGTKSDKPLGEMLAVNLGPDFLQRKAAGDLNWATVTEIDASHAIRTVTKGADEGTKRALIFQPELGIDAYVKKTNNQAILDAMKNDIGEFDANMTYTIMVPKETKG